MHPTFGSTQLNQRLRALREQAWPGQGVTQLQLSEAFSTERPTSVPTISSWENQKATPTPVRLEAYARFFATERSIQGEKPRLLPVAELSDDERERYDTLFEELSALLVTPETRPGPQIGSTLWHFPDGSEILIVCARLPPDLTRKMGDYTDPRNPDYMQLYTYADVDSLLDLYGHLRMVNPLSNVNFITGDKITADDYSKHLVLLGGIDWNPVTRELLSRLGDDLPVRQATRLGTDESVGFEAKSSTGVRVFMPKLQAGQLTEDVAHFDRRPNPFNYLRTVTICNGMYGRGTLGAVRALTDIRFRDRNDQYARAKVEASSAFSLLMRVRIIGTETLTPDWTMEDTRLYEWPEVAN
jgi:hypothetical protein